MDLKCVRDGEARRGGASLPGREAEGMRSIEGTRSLSAKLLPRLPRSSEPAFFLGGLVRFDGFATALAASLAASPALSAGAPSAAAAGGVARDGEALFLCQSCHVSARAARSCRFEHDARRGIFSWVQFSLRSSVPGGVMFSLLAALGDGGGGGGGGGVWRDDKCVCVAQTDLVASQLRNSEGTVELASRRTDLVASQLRSTGQLRLVAMPTEPLHN